MGEICPSFDNVEDSGVKDTFSTLTLNQLLSHLSTALDDLREDSKSIEDITETTQTLLRDAERFLALTEYGVPGYNEESHYTPSTYGQTIIIDATEIDYSYTNNNYTVVRGGSSESARLCCSIENQTIFTNGEYCHLTAGGLGGFDLFLTLSLIHLGTKVMHDPQALNLPNLCMTCVRKCSILPAD
jgi:hypothetical protein